LALIAMLTTSSFMMAVQQFLRGVRIAAIAMLCMVIAAESLLAQAPVPPGSQQASKSYAIPYFVVVLACALGLLIVCRSANRSSDVKRTDD
jgi:hypothetical protein